MDCFQYRNDQLYAENVPLLRIAAAAGTPCYVYSSSAIRHNWLEFSHGMKGHRAQIFYSVKSNSNLGVLALLANLGSGFDIVSGGELERVLHAGGDPTRTIFSGVGKSSDEIRLALKNNLFSLNIESEAEFERICQIAQELGATARISIRVNPDVDARTHPHISTGLKTNKFGVPFRSAKRIFRAAAENENLEIVGIAVHIGSQMTSLDPIIAALERIIDLAEELAEEGVEIQHLDLGGGLGVRYRDESPPSISEYCASILEVLGRRNWLFSISIEPGRSITANAGVLVTKIEYLKNSTEKSFAIVDGAMNDLLRPALYDAWMEIKPLLIRADENPKLYDVVGPVCESGDFLGKDRQLSIRQGDFVAVCNAGAYGAVMSSNYNTRPRPAEVMVCDDRFDVVRRRETALQILELESKPQFF